MSHGQLAPPCVGVWGDEVRTELEEGTRAAAAQAKVPELAVDGLDHLLEFPNDCVERFRENAGWR